MLNAQVERQGWMLMLSANVEYQPKYQMSAVETGQMYTFEIMWCQCLMPMLHAIIEC